MINLKDIKEAREKIKNSITETPIVESIHLSKRVNSNIYLKLENLQKTGSFKIRGATNKILNLTDDEKKRGVVANSAGNHAQGVALAAKLNGINATIVMPENAPLTKVNATRDYGAKVVQYGLTFDEAFKKAKEIEEETKALFLHAFNDEYVISGQGTIGLEIYENLPNVDTVIVPIGGGGIIAGIAIALKEQNENIKIIGIESEEAASMKDAIDNNEIKEVSGDYTIADGIAVRKVGNFTYDIVKKYVDEIYTVNDNDITRAILELVEKNKVIAEGAGAVGVASLIANKVDRKYLDNKNVCVVISGGNIDVNDLEKYINKAQILENRRVELEIILSDKAGELNKFTEILKKYGASILYINQTRYDMDLKPTEQKLEVVLECKNKENLSAILKEIEINKFKITRKN